jgi:hypothetical protein
MRRQTNRQKRIKAEQSEKVAYHFAATFLDVCEDAGIDALTVVKGGDVPTADQELWESFEREQRVELIKLAFTTWPLSERVKNLFRHNS